MDDANNKDDDDDAISILRGDARATKPASRDRYDIRSHRVV